MAYAYAGDAKLSDLGFASAFVPPAAARIPAVSLSLTGDAPVTDWKVGIQGHFRDLAVSGDSASELLSLSGIASLQALSAEPGAAVTLDAVSGALASRLWALAGQKDGRFTLKADAKANAGSSLTASADVKLSLVAIVISGLELYTKLGFV